MMSVSVATTGLLTYTSYDAPALAWSMTSPPTNVQRHPLVASGVAPPATTRRYGNTVAAPEAADQAVALESVR